jgi:transposase
VRVARRVRAGGPGKRAGGDTGTAPWADLTKFPGLIHQLCCQHLIRDLEDAAQTYPDAHWPSRSARPCRG